MVLDSLSYEDSTLRFNVRKAKHIFGLIPNTFIEALALVPFGGIYGALASALARRFHGISLAIQIVRQIAQKSYIVQRLFFIFGYGSDSWFVLR